MAQTTFGGRPLATAPPPDPAPAQKQANYDAFLLWDMYFTLIEYRTRAILLHERRESLGERMDANAGHKDWGAAFTRMTQITDQIRELHAQFLAIERSCQACWGRMSARQRKGEGLDVLYSIPASSASLYGMWRRRLGQSPMPPPTMKLDQVALMFAPTAQIQAYLKENTR